MKQFSRTYQVLPIPHNPLTRAEIDLCALRRNYRLLLNRIRKTNRNIRPIAVLKADAYGHGAAICAAALAAEGCDFFAVASLEEAVALRAALRENEIPGDILILGCTDPQDVATLARDDLIQTLLSESYAEALANAAEQSGVRVRTHIALDTGMNRIGFPARNTGEMEAAVRSVLRIRHRKSTVLEGMFSHFARADEGAAGEAFCAEQSRRFRVVRDQLAACGAPIPFCHLCNSAASVNRPDDLMDGARLGILLWGAVPPENPALPLSPVMKLRTKIVHLHDLPAGESVGYGATYRPGENRLIATLPIGYADGWLRAYSGATVTVHTRKGKRTVRVVGRVCMDQCMADVTGTAAQVGDTVTLFGDDPTALAELSARAGTIPYESLCSISSRVPRVYTDVKGESGNVAERGL